VDKFFDWFTNGTGFCFASRKVSAYQLGGFAIFSGTFKVFAFKYMFPQIFERIASLF
jgi:hypothetical protein